MTKHLKGMLLFLVPLMLACLTSTMHAQTSFGQIAGNVTDASGAVVPAATVTITNVGTQVVRTVTSDEKGYFILTNIPIGDYAVQVTAAGFRGENRTGVA
ncbi:MAG TPA: carboxypeptidase-like regulatory domain-containing protein, partial [Edaphobacter sp.]